MALSPATAALSSPYSRNAKKWFSDIQKTTSYLGISRRPVIRSSSEARAYTHLDLAWVVALSLGGTPIRSTLEAHAGVGEIEVVHDVGDNSRELHAYLFVDNELLLDAHIQVEVSQAADPPATAASAIEAQQQGPNTVIDRSRVLEDVDGGRTARDFYVGSD